MRIAILGAGGLGGMLAPRLILAGEQVAVIARGPHLDAIRSSGITLETPREGVLVAKPWLASDNPADAGTVDAVVLATKIDALAAAAKAAVPLLGPGTAVLTLQNGIDAPEVVASVLGPERVIAGAIVLNGQLMGPGRIRQNSPALNAPGTLRLGELDGRRTPRLEDLAAAFARAGLHVTIQDDIRAALFDKLLFISGNGVDALTRAPRGVTRALPETRALWLQVREEAAALARATGHPLPPTWVDDQMKLLDAAGPGQMSSLAVDIIAGRPSELDHLVGPILRLARQAAIPTPTYDRIYAALLPQDLRARASPPLG